MLKLYLKMAFINIRSNRKTYLPYMLSCVFTISIYYIVCSLSSNDKLADLWGGNYIQTYMGFGLGIVSIFALIFLFYINSFLIKRRKGEFGLYNILGMDKKHISGIMFVENIYTFFITIVIGILLGILLDKLMYMIISHMFDADIPLGFYISGLGITHTIRLFGLIFLLIFLNSLRQIYKAKPVELLKSDNAGEKEPKAKWLLAVLGLVCLAAGYIISLTTTNPVAAFGLFFIAVILVIIGTYLMFTAGSIALLKILKKNKNYYYKTNHFVSVSSMMYRMKRNAVGLANICILSTMVLVMLASTLTMQFGIEDSFNKRYPSEIKISAVSEDPALEEVIDATEEAFKQEGLELEDRAIYRNLSFSAVYEKEKDYFNTSTDDFSGMSAFKAYNNLATLIFVPLEDYNKNTGSSETLADGEVLVCSTRAPLENDEINIFDIKLHVKKNIDEFMKDGSSTAYISNGYFVVTKDISAIESILEKQSEAYGDNASFMMSSYTADVSGSRESHKAEIIKAYDSVKEALDSGSLGSNFSGYIDCASAEEDSFGLPFTGLLFICIFLGLLFIMATVLIMYYKQITEGFEDKDRFEIMQNVGMSHREVRKSINSQILIVFFLPLITAGIHIAFAFPFIYRILILMNLFNMKLFALCTGGCFIAFAFFYTIVYTLTSRLYYGIVKH